MKTKILKLTNAVINQIAAGEVVENPASIVKELVENSIDAKASRIAVEIDGGGLQSIRVVDDGCGMGREDAIASLERHATSKIRAFDDLMDLSTMGFRGEALAAIAAVSRFEMATSDEQQATRVVVEGGKFVCEEPCARNRGTTISVRSLFFNVPARKKFQKSASACASQVRRIVETLSLAHPEIVFSLSAQGKKLFETSEAKDWKPRTEEILGKFEHEIHFEVEGIKIWGFAGSPEKAALNRSGQHIFINRRPVFSPLISRAAKEGYATRIDASSHPVFILFMGIPSDQVDVNVHPQKKEVRFQNEAKIFRLVQEAVSLSLSAMPELASLPAFSFQDAPIQSSHFLPWETPEIRPFIAKDEPSFDFVCQERILAICGPYLLLQKENLLLVDLKALHARLLYESIGDEKQPSQALMWPLEIETHSDCVDALNELGIECRRIGERAIAIDALPPFLDASDFPDFFKKWEEGKEIAGLASRFCCGLKKQYSVEEAEKMWRELQNCKDRRYDPSGHPISMEIGSGDLERLMGKKR